MATCCQTGIMGLLCRNNCSIARTFASLAFQPPPPSYDIVGGKMRIILEGPPEEVQLLEQLCAEVQTFQLPTPGSKHQHMTSVFQLTYPGALQLVVGMPASDVECLLITGAAELITLSVHILDARRTIVFSHANGADCGLCLPHMSFLRTVLKANVVFYEYRGYAGQRRRPKIAAMEANAIAAYHHAVSITPQGAERIVVYGQSLGSHPTCFLGARFPVAGVVVHSGVASGMQVVFGPRVCCSLPSFLCACDSLRNEDTVRRIVAPICVIHGLEDEVVACWHGERLHDRAPAVPKCGPLWIPGAGHNDTMIVGYQEIAAHLKKFFEECVPSTQEMEVVSVSAADSDDDMDTETIAE